MMNWSMNIDCCNWDGITCNNFTGEVIGIDLTCGMLQGAINPNSSLFHLPHLQKLNLAYNDFSSSQLPSEIGRFSNSLTHLNISACGLEGDVPMEILFLPKLVSLDLSMNVGLKMKPYILSNLLQNSTNLKELSLHDVDIGWVLPNYLNISSPLKSINLKYTGLQGKLPRNMFDLRYLEQIDLSGYYNYLTGPLPKINKTLNIPLKQLDLSFTNLSGESLSSIGHLTSLNSLGIGDCGLYGPFPESLLNLTQLTTLNFESNMLTGKLPSLLSSLPLIKIIYLDSNLFTGGLPSEFFNRSLEILSLAGNQFEEEINQASNPSLFTQLVNLQILDFSSNKFRGVWNFETLFTSLPNIQILDLSRSGFSVFTDNSTSYVNPYFFMLDLASCNLNAFPESLRAMKKLKFLGLSNNEIQGRIPDWAAELNQLQSLDLSNNSVTGLPQFQWAGLDQLLLQSNMIQGTFPPSICNMSILNFLDMSNNSFYGVIPQCLGNISSLGVINLGTNLFHDTIPNTWADCGKLEWLILSKNQFEGEVPSSLSKCRDLKILDVGHNFLNGTFPSSLGDLPELRVLVLKSNNFHGPIETYSTTKHPFPFVRFLDLSNNRFLGHLPFQDFNGMNVVRIDSDFDWYYELVGVFYTVDITVKGQKLQFLELLDGYTLIDLSNNNFEGEIPDIVGTFNSLLVLNLSHNNLNGQIPQALGNLSEIQSLDLSWNQLIGEIPQSLAGITNLEVLNLSKNHLVGRIPQGRQFNTFENSSFGGNLGLCGLPLLERCEHPISSPPETDVEEENGFTWKKVMIGYGCCSLLGLLIAYVMLLTGKPKWFNAIVDGREHIVHQTKNKRRRYIFIGK